MASRNGQRPQSKVADCLLYSLSNLVLAHMWVVVIARSSSVPKGRRSHAQRDTKLHLARHAQVVVTRWSKLKPRSFLHKSLVVYYLQSFCHRSYFSVGRLYG